MTTEKVFAKSDATGSDEQEIRSEWECRFAEPEDIPAAALEYLLTTGGFTLTACIQTTDEALR
ncbi:hypothetical protein ALQ64_03905 [Pseudomonas cannabina]|uniref:Uncharacterized protein n=1 Tax=Pseudomonas cannabina TaxID=86840 RepID=A0A3M3KJ33_PSECA|nr:hypothetical protein [Pseudomonas cannabina]RMN23037.1 hypothetical protein ALQ64_03905 [Pseudomonas cannabina]